MQLININIIEARAGCGVSNDQYTGLGVLVG